MHILRSRWRGGYRQQRGNDSKISTATTQAANPPEGDAGAAVAALLLSLSLGILAAMCFHHRGMLSPRQGFALNDGGLSRHALKEAGWLALLGNAESSSCP